jgi:undecaprenyl-diphosphatase
MTILSIIILGIIQGIAEFLPISSSAHLIIFRDLFGIGRSMSTNMSLAFDVALHLGTLLAIIVVFYKDIFKMLSQGFTSGTKKPHGKLFWYLIAATIPAGLVGALFEDVIDGFIRKQYIIIALALIIMGVIIYVVDLKSKSDKDLNKVTLKDALIIGCSQIFALIPGFSRSGTTIATGRLLGINRVDATKFSFFLSAPVVLGAVCLQLLKHTTRAIIAAHFGIFALGIITSFVVGLFCIKFLLKYINNHDFKAFMIYRIALAVVVIVMVVIK